MSNINLGPKIIPPIASTRRAQSAGLFREALRRFVWKRQGGRTPPPLHRRRWRTHRLRARVNDLPSVIKSHSLMYADDLKFFRCVRSAADSAALQENVDRVTEWVETWKLSFNASKCKSMSVTLKRNPVQYAYTVRGTVLETRCVIWV